MLEDGLPPHGTLTTSPLGFHDEPYAAPFDHDRMAALSGVEQRRKPLSGLRRGVTLHLYIVQRADVGAQPTW